MFSKNLAIILALILFLAAGLGVGYYLGVAQAPKSVSSGIESGNKTGNIFAREKIKTDLTANEAYKIAFQEAVQWSADTYLSGITLESKKFDIKGLSNGWSIVFYSKTKNKSYEILIKDGESRGGEEHAIADKKAPQTLKGEMIDSSVLAKSFFGSYPADTDIFSLKMYYSESAKKFIWTIFFPKGSYTVDAEI